MALISLQQAKAHLRIPNADGSTDEDVYLKMQAAESIILDYLNTTLTWRTTTATWTVDTVPTRVVAAILLQLGELYRFRGDDEAPPHTDGQLSPVVTNLLRRSRDLVLA